MRVLAVCESPPTTDPRYGNGSTLISARLLATLPADLSLTVVYFADRRAAPDPLVVARARAVEALPVRGTAASLVGQLTSSLPRATWQRAGHIGRITRLASRADVVYLHGLHATAAIRALPVPAVVHEVDPWSDYWAERARSRCGPLAVYDRDQAARARRLERRLGRLAAAYVVVSPADATRLSARLARPVVALPNGVDAPPRSAPPRRSVDPDLLAFVGTLDYPPNVEAVHRLVLEVLPEVRRCRPQTRLVVAGRRPGAVLLRLAGEGVQVAGDVPDVTAVFARAAVVVSPGRTGGGIKNTVAEAMSAGCPVVASVEAARGHHTGPHLRTGATAGELARLVLQLLDDPAERSRAEVCARQAAAALQEWPAVGARLAELLREAAGRPVTGDLK